MVSPEHRCPLKMDPNAVQSPPDSLCRGIFEPEYLSDSSPLSLSLLCAKYVIENIQTVPFKHVLPAQVCDDLLEVFRSIGKKNMFGRFLTELKKKHCPVKKVDFSGFDIKNKELIDFVEVHSSTISFLNLSQCNLLTNDLCKQLIDQLITVRNPRKMHRQVTCYEVSNDEGSKSPLDFQLRGDRFLWRKVISNEKLTLTTIERNKRPNSELEENECKSDYSTTVNHLERPLLTELEMYSALGMLENPEFIDKLIRQMPSLFNAEDFPPKLKTSDCRGFSIRCEHIICTNTENGTIRIYQNPLSTNRSAHDEDLDDEDFEEIEELNANKDSPDSSSNSRAPSCIDQTNQKPACIQSQWYLHHRQQQQQNPAPKRLNSSTMPYRRIPNRSSSSAAGAHISRRFESTSSTSSQPIDLTMSSCKQPPAASNSQLTQIPPRENVDVQMLAEYVNNDDDANSNDDEGNEPDFFSAAKRALQLVNASRSLADQLDSQRDAQQCRQLLPSTSFASSAMKHNLFNSTAASGATGSGGGLPATSASCPSLDSAMYLMASNSGSANSSAFNQVDYYALANRLPRSNRANSQFAYNSNPSHFDTFSSLSFSSNQSDRSATSQDGSVKNPDCYLKYLLHRNSDFSRIYRPPSTSSPSPTLPVFANDTLVPSVFSVKRDRTSMFDEKVKYVPYQVFRLSSRHSNKTTIYEVRTWEDSPLESLILGKSVIPCFDELSSSEIAELLFHPNLKNLKQLVIHEWPIDVSEYISPSLDPIVANRLLILDLSHCCSIGDGTRLVQLRNLQKLILYNTPKASKAFDAICQIKSLRHLDISTSSDGISHQFQDPELALTQLMNSLPDLASLDITGTNLAGLRQDEILGLESRKSNPLEFLGIFHTSIEASSRQNIPALRIAGDSKEEYILNSCEAYMERVPLLRMALNELFQLYRFETRMHDMERSLKILVYILGRHNNDKLVQVATSATLFYIVKSEEAKRHMGRRIKELIISRLLDAMHLFRYDQTMLRNGCLNLIHFRIPTDIIAEYSRLADILLYIVTSEEDEFVQRLGIYLLNALACQVDGEQKTIVGNLGAIEKMLQLIETRFNRNICDELMETAWSCMWNVTDETPINCERFLNNNGLEFFKSCHDKFPDSPELLRNMMGLLGNVSECSYLRYRLMKQDYITRFVTLLDSSSDGIEVSYNSAGILAHIASDGAEVWNRHLNNAKCPREVMLNRMEKAIERWDINSKRNINYRSFEPILRLLRVISISWQAQYWAVWALANLTRVHSIKYCRLLEKDDGIHVLTSFLTAERPDDYLLPVPVKRLALLTLFHAYLFHEFGDLRCLEKTNITFETYSSFNSFLRKQMRIFLFKYGFVHLATEFDWQLFKNVNFSPSMYSLSIPEWEEIFDKTSDGSVGDDIDNSDEEKLLFEVAIIMEDEPMDEENVVQ